MVTSNRSEQRSVVMAQQTATRAVAEPDPSWKSLYRAGGIAAILYIVLALVVPAVMLATGGYDVAMGGAALLGFIAANQFWWIAFQALVLETSIFAIVAFVALFVALKHVDKSWAAIGAVVACSAQLLFMAYYPVLLGLVHLSTQYAAANTAQQAVFATAAEALLAQNNAFNPVYEPLFAAGILIFSLVMLKGVFHKGVAYLGIATFVACIIGIALGPVVGLWYFLWWLPFAIWFLAVGWRLYRVSAA